MSLENFMLAETSQMQTKQMWNDSTFMRQLEKPFKRQKRTRQLSKSCWMMVWHLSLSFYLSFSLSLSFFFFFKSKKRETRLAFCWFTLQKHSMAAFKLHGQVKATCWELNPDLPHSWSETQYLEPSLLPSSVCVSRKLESGATADR